METTQIRIQGVSRIYTSEAETVVAVDSIDFTAQEGEFICLHGASGSGKTTILNLLAGLVEPSSGEITVAGNDLGTMSQENKTKLRRTVVGMVHQDDALIDEFTAVENVALPLEVDETPLDVALTAALHELDRVGLADLAKRFPHQMSGGQRQRVGIARALIGNRKILLADEPTGSLDSRSAQTVYEILSEIAASGVLVIVASHDPECRKYATRVLEVRDGSLLVPAGSAS
ncbi:macrolide ABC transporter ATP-binding protein [Glutamicibacter uratoxydans]|uniref:Macrolide ABC transporter ATP-binding protein n=2 Tax=Glutamicibacter uratoxydans TaxID=43667 RepID=A0A4Y4DSW7_GLUUR|nr:macrolide ABC transporter ATP-binding protein [Glutamicibacter uratoxydans]